MWLEEQEPTSSSLSSLWIFGYGSLIWNPGFEYAESRRAYAVGWKRRMYQGNTFHRGDDRLPGRVATMLECPSADTNGVAFRVEGRTAIELALGHLNEREIGNGYEFKLIRVAFHRADGPDYSNRQLALTCVAAEDNEFYLGRARPSDMAVQIGTARGKAGPNHEYVLKLAEHIRALFPHDADRHLYGLEKRVRAVIATSR